MTVRDALAAGAARLAAAGVPGPARDSRRLMAEALGIAADRLALLLGERLSPEAAASFEAMISERARFRPVAQIVGRRAFWSRDFVVTSAVLDPRPETETLIAIALEGSAPARILDLGTGSGAILVTLLAEWPAAEGVGTDIDAAALAVAEANAARHDVTARARFLRHDWRSNDMAALAGPFDLVVSNPPYIPAADVEDLSTDVQTWEPRHALTAGPTGLEAYRSIAAILPHLLAPGGRALFEVGAGQGAAVAALLPGAVVHPDLDGRDRVVAFGG